jgi:hypothetical protein
LEMRSSSTCSGGLSAISYQLSAREWPAAKLKADSQEPITAVSKCSEFGDAVIGKMKHNFFLELRHG